jgi:hypothetical protein
MDKFTLIVGLAGLLLLIISLVVLITNLVNLIKRRTKFRKFITSFIIFLICFGFATSFIYLALFLQTFSRYTYEQKIGWLYAQPHADTIKITYYDRDNNRYHWFNIQGDQWMIHGYFMRWSLALRWLGAGAYFRVTRFSGRWIDPDQRDISAYQIQPESKLWRFLLRHGSKIPFIDAAYGIGAFQYPSNDTFEIHINDTGFILRKR